MKRLYDSIIKEHFAENRQMLFLMGPRQVGKTTTVKAAGKEGKDEFYYNWDNREHRKYIFLEIKTNER
jgi:predicted AAA+ superfamily ATPase